MLLSETLLRSSKVVPRLWWAWPRHGRGGVAGVAEVVGALVDVAEVVDAVGGT